MLYYSGYSFRQSRAEQEPIGQLKRIADISSEKPVPIKEETDRVQIQRQEWIDARPKLNVFHGELMQVRKYTRADLQISRPDQNGNIYLVPVMPAHRYAYHPGSGHIQNFGRSSAGGGLKLLVVKGSLAIDWLYGILRVDAVGINVDISGTRAAIVVDDSGDEGIVFLEHGELRFPEYPNVQVGAMEAVRLRRGLPPVKIDLGIQQVQQMQEFVQYNAETVWSQLRPWWQKPRFYVPAIAVTVGAGILLIDGGDNGPASGTIRIRIPQ
ncbi:MAG: hypothetical protein U5K69_28560 [Balneolaceae bacterium]|nr:hypothetical protein [Balneolaceae bacterium]